MTDNLTGPGNRKEKADTQMSRSQKVDQYQKQKQDSLITQSQPEPSKWRDQLEHGLRPVILVAKPICLGPNQSNISDSSSFGVKNKNPKQ